MNFNHISKKLTPGEISALKICMKHTTESIGVTRKCIKSIKNST